MRHLRLSSRPALSSRSAIRITLAASLLLSASVFASPADHREFDAMLHAPYRADANARTGDGARTFTLNFEYPGVEREQTIGWRLELISPTGAVVQRWYGIEPLLMGPVTVAVPWAGRARNAALPDGIYQVRLAASAGDTAGLQRQATTSQTVDAMLKHPRAELSEQTWSIQVGVVAAPAMPKFLPLPTGASTAKAATAARSGGVRPQSASTTGGLPYTVYFGNLHSQTNHSDGGGALPGCSSAQAPQSGSGAPADAYQYATNHGLDFLMTSEHNHLFDGSTGTNTAANPATAHNLYQSGVTAASSFNSGHQNFLALYGMEWGVISNGGHLNIFGSTELFGWEYNASNQLIGDTYTAKGDYASLYTLMRQRNLVGQFNHPATSAQFNAGGVDLGYTIDGDAVMATCEVLNSSAFSSNTTETETGQSNYEAACNKFLEAGYHVAFSTDQDNHCSNWGASYTNRTGVLLPSGTTLNQANFLDALRARRVFATMDKNSQLVLTANGHVMGEHFANSGALNLLTNFASSTGRTAATVAIYAGVPGRNGTVTQLSSSASTSITPATGEHFYYAKLTQDDGKILWSAPVWVSQGSGTGGGDTTPPTVSATESGSSGIIALAASASDNVGVTKVEFYIDGGLSGTSTAAPYSLAFNSTTLTNGSHSLLAKAYDAASNVGSSTAVSFAISNATSDTTPPTVSAAESGSSGTISVTANASDNVGVVKVEFYIDGVLKGSTTAAPYALALDSAGLANASHTLVAKAYDAAANVGTSGAVSFSVSNSSGTNQLIVNGGFESGAASWVGSSGVITAGSAVAAHTGTYKAWLDGYGTTHTDTLYQQVMIPATAASATLTFWLRVISDETTTTAAYDTLKVQMRSSGGTLLATLATYSNLNKGASYVQKSIDLSAYKGQTVRVYFEGKEDASNTTTFLIDDVSLIVR